MVNKADLVKIHGRYGASEEEHYISPTQKKEQELLNTILALPLEKTKHFDAMSDEEWDNFVRKRTGSYYNGR